MKTSVSLLCAAALLAALPLPAAPAVSPSPIHPAALGEAESQFRRGEAMPIFTAADGQTAASFAFVSPFFEQDEAAFIAALPQACYVNAADGQRIPAHLRQATVGDVLQHWTLYRLFCRRHMGQAERAELSRRAPDERLPHVWVAAPPQEAAGLPLCLPALGAWDEAAGQRAERVVEFSLTGPCVETPPAPAPQPAAPPPASDIALLQFPDCHDFVGYAWRQSTSSPLASAQVELLDEQGAVLARYAVADGIVQGAWPATRAHRARLLCGEEQKELELSHSSELRPSAAELDQKRATAFIYADRLVYSPGDTIHLCGMVRSIRERQLLFPQEGLRAELNYSLPAGVNWLVGHKQPLKLAADGSFVCSIKLPENMYGETFSFFHVSLFAGGENEVGSGSNLLLLQIREAPAPALRMDSSFTLEGRELRAEACVSSVHDVPLAGRTLFRELFCQPENPAPRGLEAYCFGDHRPHAPLPHAFKLRHDDALCRHARSKLDANGRAEASFTLPEMPFPRRLRAELVTDSRDDRLGNGLRAVEHFIVNPASLYVGMRRESCLTPTGSPLELALLLVDEQGTRYEGEAVPVELCLRYHRPEPGRYGVGQRTEPLGEEVCRQSLQLPAEGMRVTLPLERPGAYDIIVRGRDATGREFASAIRQYAWQAGEPVPWVENYGKTLVPEYEKREYRVGETVRLRLPGEVEGEAIILIQGAESRRVLRCPVRADSRWVSIPLLVEDGPSPRVELALVQGPSLRACHGRPAVQRGTCRLLVRPHAENLLSLSLQELPENVRGGESIELSGCVRDAQGQPVPHATVLVCVQNISHTAARASMPGAEFTVQEQWANGTLFRSTIGLRELPTLSHPRFPVPWLGCRGPALTELPQLPESAAGSPMQRVQTDAAGRFRAQLCLPEGRAVYQVSALALGALPAQHGVQTAVLQVDAPLALQADLPEHAHVGDVLEVPLHLRLDSLPPGAPQSVRWRIRAVSQSGLECLEEAPELELGAGQLVSLSVPLRLTTAGTARFAWRAEAVEGQPGVEGMTAATTGAIDVLPQGEPEEQPQLTRRYERRLENGQWEASTHFQQGDIVRITIEREGQRLESAATKLHDHLPAGWEPLLHPYTNSWSAPWVPEAIVACRRASAWQLDKHIIVVDYQRGKLTHPKAIPGSPLRLCYLAQVGARGVFCVPPARCEGEVEATSAPSHVQVE